MNGSLRTRRVPTPAKGSWEERLIEGKRLLAKYDDSGRVLLQNLVDRLLQMPETVRLANEHRLNDILLEAIQSLAQYLTYRDRFAEAAALLEKTEAAILSTEERSDWRLYRASVLLLGESKDEGFELLKTLAMSQEKSEKRLNLLRVFLDQALYWRRFDRIEKMIAELEQAANRASAASGNTTEARTWQAALAFYRARYSLAQNQVDEAMAWMEHALAQMPLSLGHFYSFVLELLIHGEYEKTLKWVQRDKNSMLSQFLSAYIAHHLGKHAEAERTWRKILREGQDENASIELDLPSFVLSDYYLGGKEGLGLSLVLGLMQEGTDIDMIQFYLAGLGWAIRKEKLSAHSNFKQAVIRAKILAYSSKLESFWWLFCKDLIPAEDLPEYEGYFDTSFDTSSTTTDLTTDGTS